MNIFWCGGEQGRPRKAWEATFKTETCAGISQEEERKGDLDKDLELDRSGAAVIKQVCEHRSQHK